MNKFDIDKEAKLLRDTRSPYNLAREVVELREKLKEPQTMEDLATRFGIPLTQETEEGEGVLVTLIFCPEGIQAQYVVPPPIHEIKVEGVIH